MRVTRRATIALDDGPTGRTLVADLIPWNVAARVSDDGRSTFTETWEPGSLVADDGAVLPVFDGHMPTPSGVQHGPLIGRVIPLESSSTAFRARIELADTVRARDVHALAELVGATVSIEADTPEPPVNWDGRAIVRTARDPSRLIGVAVELLPNVGAFPGATVTAVRAQPQGGAMPAVLSPTDPITPDPDDPNPNPDRPEPDGPAVTIADVDERIRGAVARIRLPQPAGVASELARYSTLAEFTDAAFVDTAIARVFVDEYHRRRHIARALADQITTNNLAVVHQGWLNEIVGIVDMGRPVIDAVGTAQLPSEGMTINWPVFAGDLQTLVGVQATEKTQIVSVRVDITSANAALITYAGGSDLSYQLIRRSAPSYREAYMRIMFAAYAAVTDKAASAALKAVISAGNGNWVAYDPAAADPDGSGLRGAIFAGSVKVQAATGQPASVVLCSPDMFVKVAGKLNPLPVFNAAGTATASTLDVNVSGLRVVNAPYLAAGSILVTNGLAASWREDGPYAISAEDVARLGENVAVWGMAVMTVQIPKGVVSLQAIAPTMAEGETVAAPDPLGINPAPKAGK